jgi:hypothetical protein
LESNSICSIGCRQAALLEKRKEVRNVNRVAETKTDLTVLFHHHDMDNDGYLARDDYAAYARRVCEALGFAPGSAEYDAVHTQTLAAWDTDVLRAFDRDGDNRVSRGIPSQ